MIIQCTYALYNNQIRMAFASVLFLQLYLNAEQKFQDSKEKRRVAFEYFYIDDPQIPNVYLQIFILLPSSCIPFAICHSLPCTGLYK